MYWRVDGVMALKTKIPLKSSVLMLNIFQRTVTCEGWIIGGVSDE